MSSGSEREQELRRLLSEAVEPVEPAPGAQTRLLARARAQQRRRRRPLMARLGVPAAAVSLLAIIVLAVVFAGRANHGSSGSSASTAEAGGALPSRAPSSSSAAASSANPAVASPEVKGPSRKELSTQKGASTTYNGTDTSASQPQADSLRPSDLDGDGRPDTFTLSGGTLVANLSRDGEQSVNLPPLGPGARVLGVTSLTDQNGAAVAVVFVRLRQVGSTATDTIASLVDGRLKVLQQGSRPVLLTIDATHGYACSEGTLAASGSATRLVVEGARLVPSPGVGAAAAAAPVATSRGCAS